MLGVVQGVTEFLPISSDGHLVTVPYLFSWPQPSLAFGVALHIGTLLAVITYFAADLWFLGTRTLGLRGDGAERTRARRTVALLVIGSIPAAIVGFSLEDFFGRAFEQPLAVSGFFLVSAAFLVVAERVRRGRVAAAEGIAARDVAPTDDPGRDESTVTWVDAIVIGAAQSLALLPGLSRSGSTIAVGMLRGLSRQGAARYSFLLSIPAVTGAAILEMSKHGAELFGPGQTFTPAQTGVGIVAAAISGFLAIRYLLRLVASDDLTGFARYLVFAAILVALGYAWLGPPDTTGV